MVIQAVATVIRVAVMAVRAIQVWTRVIVAVTQVVIMAQMELARRMDPPARIGVLSVLIPEAAARHNTSLVENRSGGKYEQNNCRDYSMRFHAIGRRQ